MDILHRKLTDMGGNHHNGICVAGKKEKKKSIVIYLFIYLYFFFYLWDRTSIELIIFSSARATGIITD